MTDDFDESRERELRGVCESAKELCLKEGYILTDSAESETEKDGIRIKVMPCWKFCLHADVIMSSLGWKHSDKSSLSMTFHLKSEQS